LPGRWADHGLFVADGRIAESGPAAELFGQPRTEALRKLPGEVLKY